MLGKPFNPPSKSEDSNCAGKQEVKCLAQGQGQELGRGCKHTPSASAESTPRAQEATWPDATTPHGAQSVPSVEEPAGQAAFLLLPRSGGKHQADLTTNNKQAQHKRKATKDQ